LEQRIFHRDWDKPTEIIAKLETKIAKQTPIEYVLRLLIIFSISLSGYKEKEWDHIRKILIQNYGY